MSAAVQAARRDDAVDARARPAHAHGGGALVAVCALCGGAGATTVAYLTARAFARATRARVLACDTGGPSGGLLAYAGAQPTRSLPGVANAVAAHEPLADALFAHAADGLRVMASRPALDAGADAVGLARVLHDARAAHALTVVDCGLPASATERQVIEAATHVAWVLPATLGGVRRGQPLLELFGLERTRGELVVAREDASGRRAPTHELAQLAELRHAPLVLMPHVPDLGEHPAEEALDEAALTLDAIRMAVSR
jgi:Flp pilus assembly CpaE family ATPase